MQPPPRFPLNVRRITQTVLALCEFFYQLLVDLLLLAQSGDLPALGDVLPDRVSQAQRDRAHHDGQNRRPAGQVGLVRFRSPGSGGL
jgi:hypothetical protein